MHVRELALQSILNHDASVVALPETGIVVVTGGNGDGKSTLVEGVAVAGWGKTLRGSAPWKSGAKQHAAGLKLGDGLAITRTRKGNKGDLSFAREGEQPITYETATKAQDALDRLIGTFDVWRRAHVFSSSDASHFTLAADAERKRLLETILGLERFDDALDACRGDMKAASEAATKAQREREAAKLRLDNERRRLTEAQEGLRALGPPPPDPGPDRAVPDEKAPPNDSPTMKALAGVERDLAAARARGKAAGEAGAGAGAELRAAEALLGHLQGESCPTCTQDIPGKLREAARARAEAARAQVSAAREKAQRDAQAADDEVAELEEERRILTERKAAEGAALAAENAKAMADFRALAEAMAAKQSYDRRKGQLDKVVSSASGEIEKLAAALATAEETERANDAALKILIATERVLGLKGVRAQLLGRALDGLQSVANTWLAKLGLGGAPAGFSPEAQESIARLTARCLHVELRPYSEKKSGGVSDSIGLDIIGAGGGLGYRAASAGERRRIDLAMMLALAEVSGAAHGRAPGTLWFDEVFDALDPEGVESVISALEQLAATRAVVVITHNPELARRLPATKRLRVSGGAVS